MTEDWRKCSPHDKNLVYFGQRWTVEAHLSQHQSLPMNHSDTHRHYNLSTIWTNEDPIILCFFPSLFHPGFHFLKLQRKKVWTRPWNITCFWFTQEIRCSCGEGTDLGKIGTLIIFMGSRSLLPFYVLILWPVVLRINHTAIRLSGWREEERGKSGEERGDRGKARLHKNRQGRLHS